MGASVVACCDAPPVLEPAEHVFDPVALPLKHGVIRDRDVPVRSRRNAGCDAASKQGIPEPVSIVATVSQHGLCGRQSLHHERQALVIAHLALAQQKQPAYQNLLERDSDSHSRAD
jgi:hypothetical protein